jgi:hypothetical protein
VRGRCKDTGSHLWRGGTEAPRINPEDRKRDLILRYLYERHRTSRGITKTPLGIQELHRQIKTQHEMKQADVSSNLDYLVQVGIGGKHG